MLPAYGIIPARYSSSRLPGKPLLMLQGKPMFWHVWHRASQCKKLSSVILATDDDRIVKTARELNVPCVLTSSEHQSGTDRVHEAALLSNLPNNSIVVNIQGDEPALDPQALTELLGAFTDKNVQAATLAHPIGFEEAQNPNKVKVACALNGDALYFSRASIPYVREENSETPYLGHVGLYAFTMQTLQRFVTFAQSPLENTEKLEQLRLLENGIPLRVVLTTYASYGVDVEKDIEKILPLLTKK